MAAMLAKKALTQIAGLFPKRLAGAATAVFPTVSSDQILQVPYKQPLEMMPRPKGMCPIFGSALVGVTKYRATSGHRMIMDKIHSLGKTYYDKILDYESVNVASPDDAAAVFRHEGKQPVRPDFVAWREVREKMGVPLGVVLSNGDQWHSHRRAMDRQLLVHSNLYKYVPSLNEIAADYIELLLQNQQRNSEGYIENLKHEQFRWSLESISRLLYDKRIGCLSRDGSPPPQDITEFANAVDTVFETSMTLVVMNSLTARILVPLTYWRHQRAWKTIFRIGKQHVEAKVAELKKAEEEGRLEEVAAQGGFMLSLFDEKWRTSRQRDVKLDVDQACCNAVEVMAAGVDTVSTAQQWLMHLLARNQDKQDRLREELEPVKKGMITPAYLTSSKSAYLKACVKEALRLRPILVGTGRVLDKDLVIGGYNVPKGTAINILDFIMATDEDNFPNPGAFIPERWFNRRQVDSDEKEKKNTQNFASLPFGFGARNCIGRRFAETEMYILTSRIVRDYQIVDMNGHMIEPATGLLLMPKEPVKIRLEKVL